MYVQLEQVKYLYILSLWFRPSYASLLMSSSSLEATKGTINGMNVEVVHF